MSRIGYTLLRSLPRNCSNSNYNNNIIFGKNVRHITTGAPVCNQKWVIKSKHADVHIPDKSFSQYIFDAQEKWADKICLVSIVLL